MTKVEKVINLNGQIESLRNINKDLIQQLYHHVALIRNTEKRLEKKIQFRKKLNYEIEGVNND
jgi:hypothetical protein